MRNALLLLLTFFAVACSTPTLRELRSSAGAGGSPRVLVVTAHPDDEIAFAGALYKISTHLGGVVDLLVITNGEAGYKYSTLAERLYGAKLTDEEVGRRLLPEIRARELAESAYYLGIHGVKLLGEKDHQYTQELDEVFGPNAKIWNLERVRRELDDVLTNGRYDFVFGLRPRPTTHAHHKAATLLAAEAVLAQPEARRPVMMVVQVVDHSSASPLEFAVNDGGLVVGPFPFDRTQKFGHEGKLDYRIVANWGIAAHKSQGTMQNFMRRGEREEYFLFGEQRLEGARMAAELFERLREPQYREATTPAKAP